jgi:hypothetical protein
VWGLEVQCKSQNKQYSATFKKAIDKLALAVSELLNKVWAVEGCPHFYHLRKNS